MSIPLRRFSRLSLEMPTTRSQNVTSRMAEDRDSSPEEEEDQSYSFSEDDTAESPTIKGPSQLQYDVRRLSPTTKSRVRHAFKRGRFDVDHCLQADFDQPDGYYAFQVAETTVHPVRIGRPTSRFPTPQCFCGDITSLEPLSEDEFTQLMDALDQIQNSETSSQLRRVYEFVQENGMLDVNSTKACRHVYWLLDQIAGYTLQDHDQNNLYTLSRDGAVIQAGPAFQQISRIGLENLAREKNWKLRVSHSHPPTIKEDTDRIAEARDIVASLSSSTRHDIFDQLPHPLTQTDVLVPHDIEATLARALLVNDACFNFFKSAIPLSYRATTVFHRLGEQAKKSLTLLDEYIASASQRGIIPTNDVSMTAQVLKDVVASVEEEYEARSHAVGPEARSAAAKVLVFILNAVVSRDKDVYAGLRRPRIPVPQRAVDRNLYQLLIGSASRHEGFFVIDVLNAFPDAAIDMVDELEDIYNRIATQGAQEGYLNRMRRIIDQLRGRDSVERSPGPSSSKRPSEAAEGRAGKRRQMK